MTLAKPRGRKTVYSAGLEGRPQLKELHGVIHWHGDSGLCLFTAVSMIAVVKDCEVNKMNASAVIRESIKKIRQTIQMGRVQAIGRQIGRDKTRDENQDKSKVQNRKRKTRQEAPYQLMQHIYFANTHWRTQGINRQTNRG